MTRTGLILKENDLFNYIIPRQFESDIEIRKKQMDNLENAVIFNAYTFGEAMGEIGPDNNPHVYFPELSSEAHIFNGNTMYIVNTREDIRRERDENQISKLGFLLDKNIETTVVDYANSRAAARNRFKQFAFDIVDQIFSTVNNDSIARSEEVYVIFGPHDSLNSDKEIKKNEFLNFRILEPNIFNFDYAFSNQELNVLDGIMLQIDSLCQTKGVEIDLHVFHYGKQGFLNNRYHLGGVGLPISAEDEKSVIGNKNLVKEIDNRLVYDTEINSILVDSLPGIPIYMGKAINSNSVLDQSYELLRKLRSKKMGNGDMIDMEFYPMYRRSLPQYKNMGNTFYYLGAVGSDKPLVGKNLGNTKYKKMNERFLADAYMKIIQHIQSKK